MIAPLVNVISTVLFLFMLPVCYVLGSVMSAILVAQYFSLPDPRQYGSKNPGTTNMARQSKLLPAALTFLGDLLKGFIPVKLAILVGYSPFAAVYLGFATMLGHMFPLFYNYQGGKGMATALGVTFAISWQITLANSCIWIFFFWLIRTAGLASVISVCTLPVFYLASPTLYPLTPHIMVFSSLIVWMHGHNLMGMAKKLFGIQSKRWFYN